MRRVSARQTAKGAEDRGATVTRMVRSSLEKPPRVVSTSEKNTPPPTHPEKAKTLASARHGIHSKDEGLGLREGRLEQMSFIRKISARRRPCDGCKESHGHSLGKVESGRDFTAETQRDFPGGAEPGTPCSQCQGSGSDLCSGNQTPPPATKSLHAAAKDPTCPK